ncbi:MAG: hypothetical protein IPL01_21495 [Acidobacteria bacterium]|nr:hypothetical protein [Acidobacteriota bacterium]
MSLSKFTLILTMLLFAASARLESEPSPDWKAQSSGVLARFNSVIFIDEKRGWAAGSNGALMVTDDGGSNWRKHRLPQNQAGSNWRDLAILPGGRAILLGELGIFNRDAGTDWSERIAILLSEDGGGKWIEGRPARPVSPPSSALDEPSKKSFFSRTPDSVLVRTSFVDGLMGWACGEGGTIQATMDGGRTWQFQNSRVRKLLLDVKAVDERNIWIAGSGGTILYSKDGGLNWNEQRSGVTAALRSIRFIDSKRGWAAGADGTIIATTDGGLRWATLKSDQSQSFNDIFLSTRKKDGLPATVGFYYTQSTEGEPGRINHPARDQI